MTRLEKVHTLIEEDKDALVGSYLSLLAFIHNHQKLNHDNDKFLSEITDIVHRHIELLPESSQEIFNELSFNESERIDSNLAGRVHPDNEGIDHHEFPS